jgi:dTDP-4-dehydrorhamnose reductase
MKILIFGGSGMLGHKLNQLWKEKFEVITTLRKGFSEYERFNIFERDKVIENVEIEQIKTVQEIVEKQKPDVIVNAIGIIKQLPSAKNTVKTLWINSIFPHQLAEISEQNNSRLITISTDCVFDGKKGNYTEEDIPNAIDLYGQSKHLGEVVEGNALTIRTSIIGRELQTCYGLVEWFLSNEGRKVNGFSKAIFSGFPTCVFANILEEIITKHKGLKGLHHISSEPINKLDLLKLIKNAYKSNIEIVEFSDFEIDRSLDSTKFKEKTNFQLQDWETMVNQMATDSTPYDDWK